MGLSCQLLYGHSNAHPCLPADRNSTTGRRYKGQEGMDSKLRTLQRERKRREEEEEKRLNWANATEWVERVNRYKEEGKPSCSLFIFLSILLISFFSIQPSWSLFYLCTPIHPKKRSPSSVTLRPPFHFYFPDYCAHHRAFPFSH